MKAIKEKKLVKWAAAAVQALIVLAAVVTVVQAVRGGLFDKIVYTVDSYDRKLGYELVRVQEERDKAPIYVVRIDSELFEVAAEVWETYLGEDYNTVTYHVEEVSLYKKDLLGGYLLQKAYRGNYPWEDPVLPFTGEEIDTLVADVRKRGGWGYKLETNVEVHGTAYGHSTGNDLENSATEYKDKEIDWWWKHLWNCLVGK